MPNFAPSVQELVEQIQSSDRFTEVVEEIAQHFHEPGYKDDRLPEIKALFRQRAEQAGLSEDEADGVAGRLVGTLMQRAEAAAPPPPTDKWDPLEPEQGPLPESRYDELPGPFYQLLRLVQTETEPFRQVHRLIDAVEWAVKWHTTLALSDLLSRGEVPDPVKVLLAQSLQTPSLGTWNHFFRQATGAFKEIGTDPALPWARYERLTDLEPKHHLVRFRNEYAHGATPPAEECKQDVETYRPVLEELVHSPLFTDVDLVVRGEGHGPERLRGPKRSSVEVEVPETDLLTIWREALLEHEENPRPLLRRSLTLYPFDAEAAAEGVYSLVQAHVQAGAMDHAEAIAEACPELELDVLAPEPEPPVPEGHDPEALPSPLNEVFDQLVGDYKDGRLDDGEFEERVTSFFELADDYGMLEGIQRLEEAFDRGVEDYNDRRIDYEGFAERAASLFELADDFRKLEDLHEKGMLEAEDFKAEVEEMFEEADLA